MLELFVAGHLSNKRMQGQFDLDAITGKPRRPPRRLGVLFSKGGKVSSARHTAERRRAAQHSTT
jgi:hypothetical protein